MESKSKHIHKNIKDLSNKRFGKLTAIRNLFVKKNGCYIWECQCDCGNIVNVPSGWLGSGNTKSCGCVGKEKLIKHNHEVKRLPNKQGIVNTLYGKYKISAKKRKLEFSLTIDEFRGMIESNCYYCGESPSGKFNQDRCEEVILYNGIDRIDNKLGYTISNTVSCCKQCNTMKMNYSLEDFYKKILLIYKNRITNIQLLDGIKQL